MDELMMQKLQTMTVLYVDNDDSDRSSMSEILSLLFGSVHLASNGIQAYDMYKSLNIDLIITGIEMLKMDGIELVKKIRQTDNKTSVIIISKYVEPEFLIEAVELNLIRYIPKPIDENKLLDALAKFVKQKDNEDRLNMSNGWVLDFKQNSLIIDGNLIPLTKKEAKFLELCSNKKGIVSYEEINKKLWRKQQMSLNALRLMVKNLRKKLPTKSLTNVQGIGYKLH